jgi:SWI/SNF-related matrix-associated actin-dependent regulator 1 of chromatin subfamily A
VQGKLEDTADLVEPEHLLWRNKNDTLRKKAVFKKTTFPVSLTDSDGNVLSELFAPTDRAKGAKGEKEAKAAKMASILEAKIEANEAATALADAEAIEQIEAEEAALAAAKAARAEAIADKQAAAAILDQLLDHGQKIEAERQTAAARAEEHRAATAAQASQADAEATAAAARADAEAAAAARAGAQAAAAAETAAAAQQTVASPATSAATADLRQSGFQLPVNTFGLPGRYANALYSTASKSNALSEVETDLQVHLLQLFRFPCLCNRSNLN